MRRLQLHDLIQGRIVSRVSMSEDLVLTHVDLFNLPLSSGADVNVRDEGYGNRPLDDAIYLLQKKPSHGRREIVEMLRAAGAERE